MPKIRRCWVPKCPNNQTAAAEKTRLFLFPRDVDRCLLWLKAIGDEELALCPWKCLVKCRYVCIEHFLPKMLTATGRVMWNAVPILFTDVRPVLPDSVFKTFLESVPIKRAQARDAAIASDARNLPARSVVSDRPYSRSNFSVADACEGSNEFDSFADVSDPPYSQNNFSVADTCEDNNEFDLFVDSATLDHDYIATNIHRKFPVSDYIKTKQFCKDNQEDLIIKQHMFENLRKELCRLCGQKESELTPIFEPAMDTTMDTTMDVPISSKIDMYLPIKVKLEDSLPFCICTNCLSVLNHWHELYTTCVAADTVLSKTFGKESCMKTINNPCASEMQRNAETQTEEMSSDAPAHDLLSDALTQDIPLDALADEMRSNHLADKMRSDHLADKMRSDHLADKIPSVPPANQTPPEPLPDQLPSARLADHLPSESLADKLRENEDICKHCGESKTAISEEDKLFKQEFDKSFLTYRNTVYKCRFCSEIFRESADRRSHIAICRQLSAICEVCGLTVPCRKKLKNHKYVKHNSAPPRKYLCDKCDKFFLSATGLKSHLESVHGPEDSTGKYCCELCGSVFLREKYIHIHKRKHEKGRVKTVFKMENFRQEVSSEGSENTVVYVCPICQEKFNDMLSLAIHVTEKKKLQCPMCNKLLTCEKRLFLHVCGQWTCQYCLKSFDKKVKWMVHERLHTGEKPIKCRKCDQTFRSWQSRRFHESNHEPSFQCMYCEKSFKNKYVFQDHVACHEGKEFVCHICYKKFSGRKYLNKHRNHYHKDIKKTVCISE